MNEKKSLSVFLYFSGSTKIVANSIPSLRMIPIMAIIPIWESISKKSKDPESEILDHLSLVQVFENLSRRHLRFIRSLCHIRTYEKGTHVFQTDEPGVGMYVILSGTVEIYRMEKKEHYRSYQYLRAGDSFGELGLLEDINRSASALAKEDTRLLGFFRPDLESVLQRRPRLAARILLNLSRTIGDKLIRTNNILEDFYDPNSVQTSGVEIVDSTSERSDENQQRGNHPA